MSDTPKEIQDLLREQLMARSGLERVKMGSEMFEMARATVMASFPAGLSNLEIKALFCERLYGNEIDVEAFIKHLANRT